jgi:quinol monooxygenase YgiN
VLIVVFKLTCQPEKTSEVGDALAKVIAASRAIEGVVSFDIAADLENPNGFVATEVFADQAARDRQESLPEVASVMALLPTALAGPPHVTTYDAQPRA